MSERYTMEFTVPERERIFTNVFEAENDIDAVEKGKQIFLDKARSAYIFGGTRLIAIYRTPKNLLKEVHVISEKTISKCSLSPM